MFNILNEKKKQLDIHTLEVLKKSASSVLVKVIALLVGLLLSVALGRLLGPKGFGIINLANRIVNILIIFGLLGVRQVLIREIAIAHENGDYKTIGNMMNSSYLLNGGFTLISSVFLILLAPWISINLFHQPALTFPLIVFFLALTPQIFSRIYSSALVGYRKIWQSNLVEQALSIIITSTILLVIWLSGYEINVNLVAVLYAIGRISVALTVGLYWHHLFGRGGPWESQPKKLFLRSKPLFLSTLSAIVIANIDVVFLGFFTTAKDIGLYSAALNLALLTSFFLQIVSTAVGPKIAALYGRGNIEETQKMVRRITWSLILISVIPLFFFLGFGKILLNLWGDKFISAYGILIVLSIGQFVNVATGVAGQVLIMTGNERVNTNIMIFFVIVDVLLSGLLIYKFGVIGAAIANACIVIGLNVTKVILARAKTGISTI